MVEYKLPLLHYLALGLSSFLNKHAVRAVVTECLEYNCNTTRCKGYAAIPDECYLYGNECPAVVIIQDWDGMNEYEQERAQIIANDWGYVGFAVDIYGSDIMEDKKFKWEEEEEGSWRGQAASLHRQDAKLYEQKINAAITAAKGHVAVDPDKIIVIGYCFGGTGAINIALMGGNVLGVIGYHSGIQPDNRVVYSEMDPMPNVTARVLIHSGVMDDSPEDLELLEDDLELAGARYEIARYGSNVAHCFTKFDADMPGSCAYDQRADDRSWTSTHRFIEELVVGGIPNASRADPNTTHAEAMQYHTCDDTICLSKVVQPMHCNDASPCPAVIIIHDWDGMNEYEMERASMIADLGYVGFAADVYGIDTPKDTMEHWIAASSAHWGNVTKYMNKIESAVDAAKALSYVDETMLAVIGYCFGGSGIVTLAIEGGLPGVLGVVGYHSGVGFDARAVWDFNTTMVENQTITTKILLHSGARDAADTWDLISALELEFESGSASYEIQRFGNNVGHSFTKWGAGDPVPRDFYSRKTEPPITNNAYDQLADYRSWESSKSFFEELFYGFVPGFSERYMLNETACLDYESEPLRPSPSAALQIGGKVQLAVLSMIGCLLHSF